VIDPVRPAADGQAFGAVEQKAAAFGNEGRSDLHESGDHQLSSDVTDRLTVPDARGGSMRCRTIHNMWAPADGGRRGAIDRVGRRVTGLGAIAIVIGRGGARERTLDAAVRLAFAGPSSPGA